ncbi:class II glutamine amidotransferase [Caenispirillum salinarum]|uniref:class II glutamine amidotransferase n=1 Tax=Caenispirillum salinarum TaxID=859058 RepID=UPI0038514C79
MCRMLGFVATHPTRIDCSLVEAQHSLLRQSREDLEGFAHADGWGIAHWPHGHLSVSRRVHAAGEGDAYARVAREAVATRVLAHVRQATAGDVRIENTHPFSHGPWVLMHNGTIRHFDEGVGERMAEEVPPAHVNAIKGSTDSEAFFHFLLSRMERQPDTPVEDVLARTVSDVAAWCREAGPCENLGLNMLLSDGARLFGCRWQQSLWVLERQGVYDCQLCGRPHAVARPPEDYRAVLVASEPTTDEGWQEVPDHSVFQIVEGVEGPALRMRPCTV